MADKVFEFDHWSPNDFPYHMACDLGKSQWVEANWHSLSDWLHDFSLGLNCLVDFSTYRPMCFVHRNVCYTSAYPLQDRSPSYLKFQAAVGKKCASL